MLGYGGPVRTRDDQPVDPYIGHSSYQSDRNVFDQHSFLLQKGRIHFL